MDAGRAEEEFSRCVIRLLWDEPFFGHLLSGIVRYFGSQTPTAAVAVIDGRPSILVNPDFFLGALTEDERVAVVKHEVLHLVFKHLVRARGRASPFLWNVAADLVVNQWVGRHLPASAVTLETFPDLALPRDATADFYYERLEALGGGGAEAPESARALARIGRWHSDHTPWTREDDDDLAEVGIDGLVARTAARVGPRGWGDLPARLRSLVDASLARRRAQLDWRRIVRVFSCSSRHTSVASTHRRPSRRFGTFPGVKIRRSARLAVAIDTSGSIDDAQVAEFFAEVRGIWRQGTEVHVLECDAAVQRVYPFGGVAPGSVAGRGGTDVDPVFAWLRADGRRWDGCVYLTDGAFSAPIVRPPCPVLWVLSRAGSPSALRFGRWVRIE